MRKTVLVVFSLLTVVALVLTACGGGAAPTPTPTKEMAPKVQPTKPAATPKPEKKAKICQVTDVGGIDDRSFNATAWKGVQDAMEKLGVDGQYLESQQQTDYERNLNEFIQQDCDLIITVGFLLGDATKAAAEAHPDQKFAIVDFAYDPPLDNVLGLTFSTDEAAFLAGYLAAGMTKTGKVGTFGGINIPPVTIFMVGFESGVEYYNQKHGTNVEVLGWSNAEGDGLFTGNFESTDDGRRFAESLMDEGADIILPVAGPVGLGTAAAVKERGAMMIGVDTDWYVSAPEYKEVYLTSILKNMDVAVFDAIKAVLDGTFKGGTYVGTLKNNGVGIAPFHDFEDQVPDDLKAELEEVRKGIIEGSISTGWPLGEAKPPKKEGEAKPFRVGMISDVGGIDDASFNQSTWEGLERAAQEIPGVEAQFIESQAQADYENNITEFAEQGYDMIITVGFLLADATAKMAPLYPDIKFAIVDFAYDPCIENVQGIVFASDEAAFLGGYLAAAMATELDAKDPKVGAVFGMEIPPVVQFAVGFENGIKYYNEKYGANVSFSKTYVGDFEAPEKGKAAANSLLDEGIDVLFGAGGKTGNGALVAVRERAEAGASVAGIGVDVDQYYTLPQEKGILITSVEKRLNNAVFNTVKEAVEGNFKGCGVYVGTLANDGVGLAPFHDWEDRVPEQIKKDLEEIRQGIIDGTIKTGWPTG